MKRYICLVTFLPVFSLLCCVGGQTARQQSTGEVTPQAAPPASDTAVPRIGDGGDIRGDMARRDEWAKTMADARSYLAGTNPVMGRLVYNPLELKHESTDYSNRTATFSLPYRWEGVSFPAAFARMIKDLNEGLVATKRSHDWGIRALSPALIWGWNYFEVRASLINDAGQQYTTFNNSSISATFGINTSGTFTSLQGRNLYDSISPSGHIQFKVSVDFITDNMAVKFSVVTTDYEIIRGSGISGVGFSMWGMTVEKKRDISDRLQILTEAEYQTVATAEERQRQRSADRNNSNPTRNPRPERW